MDAFIHRYETGELLHEEVHNFPMSMNPHYFKGKKPASITFPDGTTQEVRTWKQAVSHIMKHCNADPEMHEKLMALRDIVSGRSRGILASSPEGMDRPVKVDEGLYLESYFDTETLLRVVTNHVLNTVGYDYSNIKVTLREMDLGILPTMQKEVDDQMEYQINSGNDDESCENTENLDSSLYPEEYGMEMSF